VRAKWKQMHLAKLYAFIFNNAKEIFSLLLGPLMRC